jgi:DNA-directed RNA polymerase subunit L
MKNKNETVAAPRVPTLMEWGKMDVFAKYVTKHPLVEAPVVTFTREGVVMTKVVAKQVAHDVLSDVRHLRGNPKAARVVAARNYLKAFLAQ